MWLTGGVGKRIPARILRPFPCRISSSVRMRKSCVGLSRQLTRTDLESTSQRFHLRLHNLDPASLHRTRGYSVPKIPDGATRSSWWTQGSQIGQVLYHGRDGRAYEAIVARASRP